MTDLNKELLETSEVYRNITALDCFSDEIEEMEDSISSKNFSDENDLSDLHETVLEYEHLKNAPVFYEDDGTLSEIEF